MSDNGTNGQTAGGVEGVLREISCSGSFDFWYRRKGKVMSVYRDVNFFHSDDGDTFYAVRRHRGEFNPDKHVDVLRYDTCSFTSKHGTDLVKVIDHRTGNIYYADKDCPRIQ